MLSCNSIDSARVKAEVREIQLCSPNAQVWQSTSQKPLKLAAQLDIVAIDRVVRSVITTRKRRPVMSSQRNCQACSCEKARRRCQLPVFGIGHRIDHFFNILKARSGEI